MFTTLFSLSLVFLVIRSVFAQSDLMVNTPVFVQCQLAQINWTDTCSGPYELLIASASDMCGNALEDLGYQNSTSATWNVTLAAGTQAVVYVEDSEGYNAWSGIVTVGASNDTSCLTNTTSSTPSPTVSGSTPTYSPSVPTPSSPTSSLSSASSVPSPSTPKAGLSSNSGVLSTRPASAITFLGTTVLAVVAFAL